MIEMVSACSLPAGANFLLVYVLIPRSAEMNKRSSAILIKNTPFSLSCPSDEEAAFIARLESNRRNWGCEYLIGSDFEDEE